MVSCLKGSKFAHDVLDRSIAKGGGPKDLSLDVGKAIRSTAVLKRLVAATKFNDALATVQAMPGYFANLTSQAAEERLKTEPVGSWLVRGTGTNTGGISWSWKVAAGSAGTAIKHDRLLNMKRYQTFIDYTQRSGRLLQVRA